MKVFLGELVNESYNFLVSLTETNLSVVPQNKLTGTLISFKNQAGGVSVP